MGEFDGKVAFVTGAAAGIGSAIARRLAQGGARVAINYRSDADGATRTIQAITDSGGTAMALQGDIGDVEAVNSMIAEITRSLGPISLLVNNAAYTRILDFNDLTLDRLERFFSTNFFAAYLTTYALKDSMIAQGGGSIVNISSTSGHNPAPNFIGYGASKAALDYFTAATAKALAPHGVRVNGIAPGLILTERSNSVGEEMKQAMAAGIPMKRGGDPSEVAELCAFLLSERASYITGQTVTIAGGNS